MEAALVPVSSEVTVISLMLADAAATLLVQPPDALLDIRQLFPVCVACSDQRRGWRDTGLEPGHEASRDRGLLGISSGGLAIKHDFRDVVILSALQLDGFVLDAVSISTALSGSNWRARSRLTTR